MKSLKSKTLLVQATVVLLSVLNAGCPGQSGKGSNVNATGYNPGCPGCVTPSGNIVAAALGTRASADLNLELGLRLFASGTFANPYSYYGPVVGQGYLKVNYAYWNSCPVLPAGGYTVATTVANGLFAPDTSIQPFNLQNFDFDVIHSTGYRAHIHVDYLEFFDRGLAVGADGGQYPHGMYGQMTVTPLSAAPGCYLSPVTLFFPLQ